MRGLLAICLLVLVVVGCGAEQAPVEDEDGTRLVVEVRPGRDEPVERRVVDEVPPGITAADFEPVPADTACAQIYGGPATARVVGTLDGESIDATFNRINACEMSRWDRIQALLGPAPDARP